MCRLPLTLLTLTLLFSPAWCDEAKESKLLEGSWLPTKAELSGQPFPEETLKTMKLTMGDGKYTVLVGKAVDKGTIKLDPAQKPKGIDVTGTEGPNKGKTLLAIYEITDDSLRICYDLEGRKRPTEFKTAKDTRLFLVTYKREKP